MRLFLVVYFQFVRNLIWQINDSGRYQTALRDTL
jgi:hypothetical protein